MSIRNTNYRHTSYQLFIGDDVTDYGMYVTNVDYKNEMEHEFIYPLGSKYPVLRQEGNVTCDGSITFITDGIDKLLTYARSLGYNDYLDLPLLQILIVNQRYDNTLVQIVLEDCKLTGYGIPFSKGTLIKEVQVPLKIARVIAGVDF